MCTLLAFLAFYCSTIFSCLQCTYTQQINNYKLRFFTRTLTHTHPENKTHTYTHKTHTHTQTLNTRDVDAPFSSPWSNMKSQLDAPVHMHARKKKATAEKRKKYPKMEKIFFQWMIHLFYRLKQWLWFNPVRSGVYSTQLCFTRFLFLLLSLNVCNILRQLYLLWNN